MYLLATANQKNKYTKCLLVYYERREAQGGDVKWWGLHGVLASHD